MFSWMVLAVIRLTKYLMKHQSINITCLLIVLPMLAMGQTPILEREISAECPNCTVDKSLELIETAGGFDFSYNSDLIEAGKTVNLSVSKEPVRVALFQVLGDDFTYKDKGDHLILKREKKAAQKKPAKSKYQISGYVVDMLTGERIPNTSVYDNSMSYSTVSDEFGYYTMTLPYSPELVGLIYSRKNYLDTLILVRPTDDHHLNIKMKKDLPPIDKVEAKPVQENPVEETGLVKLVVPDEHQVHIDNITEMRQRKAQISILPLIGTNTTMSGVTKNNISVNVFAGYAGGVDGVEFGGFLNIVREDVKGAQFAGLGNITGGKTRGTQFAGFFNNNRGSITGVQGAGFNNFVMDTIKGVQMAGFNNIVVGRLDGLQAAGFSNIATKNSDGLQIAGFVNVAVRELNKLQAAGFLNYAGHASGMQVAGFGNVTRGEMTGTQIAGFFNSGTNVQGLQISGFMNFCLREMSGTQLTSMLNVGGKIKGTQVGFLNFADSVSGATIGFFSFVVKGYHEVEVTANEVFYLNPMFKSGTHRFYNIFAASFYPRPNRDMYALGYGIGTDFRLSKRFDLNFDAIGYHINEDPLWTNDLNMLTKARLNLGVMLFKGVYFVLGPELNIYTSHRYDNDNNRLGSDIAPYTFYDKDVRGTNVQMWVGGTAGLRF